MPERHCPLCAHAAQVAGAHSGLSAALRRRYNWAELFSLVIIPLAVTAEVEWVRWRGSGSSITYLGHTISERGSC
jgi:hypothetical protein